ncbi:hypothetical protein ACS0TY_034637 [Phlomoides rotata]
MKNRMADIWKPIKGVTIRTFGNGRFIFEFYHPLDVSRVMNGLPWTFNNHPLLLHHLQRGEHAMRVPLTTLPFWVQVYDIPHGFVSERFGRLIGDFLGSFLEYDQTNDRGAWRAYMRVRVNVDTSLPLKRFKSIRRGEGGAFQITFKYEKLSTFCFMCGRVGHTENFCELKYAVNGGEVARGWDTSLCAPERRGGMGTGSRWLRGGVGQEMGKDGGDAEGSGTVPMQGGQGVGSKIDQCEEEFFSKELIPFRVGSDQNVMVGVLRSNPVFEEGGAVGSGALEEEEHLDERKRKRGKRIMESDSVCSTDITNDHF